jgi:predicted metalloprotease with PDZ domain
VTIAGGVKIATVSPGSGGFEAGLDIDDLIVAIDGKRVAATGIPRLMKGYSPGETVEVTVFRRDRLMSFQVVLDGGANTTYELRRMENSSQLQNQTRRDWLNLPAG